MAKASSRQMRPCARAWAAMSRSLAPIGVPARLSACLISP